MISFHLSVKTFITAFQKWRGKDYPGMKSNGGATFKFQRSSMSGTWTFCANTRTRSALTNTIWDSPKILSIKSTWRRRIRFIENNSKFQKPITNSLNRHWMNGWNWGLLRDQIHSITHPFSAFQRNKAKDFASCKTSGNWTRTPTSTNTPWRRSPNASATSGERIRPFSQPWT